MLWFYRHMERKKLTPCGNGLFERSHLPAAGSGRQVGSSVCSTVFPPPTTSHTSHQSSRFCSCASLAIFVELDLSQGSMLRSFTNRLLGIGGRAFFGITVGVLCLLSAGAQVQRVSAGDQFAAITIGEATFHEVRILDVNERSVMLRHARGLTSLPLAELPAIWQEAFGYDPAAARSEEAATVEPPSPSPSPSPSAPSLPSVRVETKPPPPSAVDLPSGLSAVRNRLGSLPVLRTEVDFSREIYDYPTEAYQPNPQGMAQGFRPSCSVYAIVGAVELQFARKTGSFRRFSERYLNWATEQITGRTTLLQGDIEPAHANAWGAERIPARKPDGDAGYTMREVLRAIQRYGMAAEPDFPDVTESGWENAPPPSRAIIAQAQQHGRLAGLRLPGEGPEMVRNIIVALNTQQPVVVGLRWPLPQGTWHGVISQQTPQEDYLHAVTLFGYKGDGTPEGTRFRLRNSWGRSWGTQGYGWVTYDYLEANVIDAMVLDYFE